MEKNLLIKEFKAKFQDQGEEVRGYMEFIINNEYEVINIIPCSICDFIPGSTDENFSKIIRFIDGVIFTNLLARNYFETMRFEDNEEHKKIILDAIMDYLKF